MPRVALPLLRSRSGAPGLLLVGGTPALAGLLALLTLGCSRTPEPTGRAVPPSGCEVSVGVQHSAPLVLELESACPHHQPTEFSAEPGVAQYVTDTHSSAGEPLNLSGDRLHLPSGTNAIRYRVELGRMAGEQNDFDVALQVGASTLAPGYSWLLAPLGIPDETPVALRWLGGPSEENFATGMTASDTGYWLRANEIPVATFSVFGRFEQQSLTLSGVASEAVTIELVTLDGPLAVRPPVLKRWVHETASAVAQFFGGFPVRRAMLVLVPVAERDRVLHGKVLPESSPGIALLVGSRAQAPQLYADWILTHELFHLGFPSFIDEGKWLDEGLATYFEPLIRARRGWLSELDVWREFYQNMPRGLSVLEEDGLESPRRYRDLYWAGASVCLMADVEARRTRPQVGLELGLRRVLQQGGDATRVWKRDRAISIIDEELGGPILKRLSERYQVPGSKAPLLRLLTELGVRREGDAIVLDDSAPLAKVRRAITWGSHPE